MLKDRSGSCATGDEPKITGSGIDDGRKCLFVVCTLRGYYHRAPWAYPGADCLQLRIEGFSIGEVFSRCGRITYADAEIQQGSKPCQGLGDWRLTDNDQFGSRQKRLDKDFQCPLAGARHDKVIDPLLGRGTVLECRANTQ